MNTHRISLLLLAASLCLAPYPALPCSCSWIYPPGTPLLPDQSPVPSPEDLQAQPFLFTGTVESITPLPPRGPEADRMLANGSATVIRLDDVWRGDLPFDTITVYTGFPGGGCGYPFRLGSCYLVFAQVESDGTLRTDICTRTTPWEQAGPLLYYVLQYLGPPQPSSQAILSGVE